MTWPPNPRLRAGTFYVLSMVLIAAVAAWPIYRSGRYVALVAVAAVIGGAIAALVRIRGWGAGITAALLAAAVLVVGVLLAVPSQLRAGNIVGAIIDVGSGVVFGWKDLITVDLPVGDYRNLLVPALVIFLVGTCVALLLTWRADRMSTWAVGVTSVMVLFAILFGRSTTSAPLQIGPITVVAPIETAVGIASVVSSVLWLAWRSRDERVRALRRAAHKSGVRLQRRPQRLDRRRAALGATMLAVAVIAVVAVVPPIAAAQARSVLRGAAGPDVDLSAEVSPLAAYRTLFSDAAADDVQFTVSRTGGPVERIRLATLDDYDGEIYRTGSAADGSGARFVRVPSVRDAGSGSAVDMTVQVGALTGIWMPTTGRLKTVDFTGTRAAVLADGFYYSDSAIAAVETAGWQDGDRYRLRGTQSPAPSLKDATAPGGISTDVATPANLRTWMDQHAAGTGGQALADLVALLRERGYLSHALAEGATTPVWAADLEGYQFEPSAAGHSLGRIDGMFADLLEREADPRAASSNNYVAAVGDDEQFSVAVALMAAELGFPARVVVGARLSSSDPSLATCQAGICKSEDISAWVEVLTSTGDWIAIDATPQHALAPSIETTEQRDPENATEVRPDAVEEVVPPRPDQADTPGDRNPTDAGADLAWLWPLLRTTGVTLLVVALITGPSCSHAREGFPPAGAAWTHRAARTDCGRMG